MSKIALSPSASGTGTLTIAAPNTNSDFTLSLPATTAPILAGSGITLSASAPANTLVTTDAGRVGIGTSSPSQKLEVGALGVFRMQTGAVTMDCTPTPGATDGFVWNVSNGYYDWNTSGTTRLRLAANGSMTLFTGDFLCSSAGGLIGSVGTYNTGTASAANVHILSNGFMLRSTSSLKYKRDVQDAPHGLAEVMALRPVTYKGKNPMDGESVFGGLIAEEVHEAGLTEFVQYADDGTPDALAYGNMVSLCIKAIQELKAKVDAQAAEIAALKGQA